MSALSGEKKQPVIGLCGGIGSGKTAVARLLEEMGCVVASSDETARAAFEDPDIRAELRSWWGEAVFDVSGEVDRSAIAHIIFASAEERRRLEALTHPWIEARRQEQFAAAPATARAFVIDAPLLFEAGLDSVCDAVIFVEAEAAVRAARVDFSRGWTAQELSRREDSQLPLDLKREKADYVIENNSDLTELASAVRRVFEAITRSNRSST